MVFSSSAPYQRFQQHKRGAKRRGVPFKLTFKEWMLVWEESGHFNKRGCRRGQYCMARHGDKGCYEVGNVSIVPVLKNQADKRQSKKAKNIISIKHRGELNGTSYLSPDEVREMRKEFDPKKYGSIVQIAKQFNVPYGTAYCIVKGARWGHLK